MRYWWVNQNQTYRHEVQGGYLWSPSRIGVDTDGQISRNLVLNWAWITA
jgi:hypothetical protein